MNIPPAFRNLEINYTKLFINNEWVDSHDGSTITVEDPNTGKEICRVSEAKKIDVDAAVAAAKAAYQPGSEWRKLLPHKRALLMNKLADLMERDQHYISSLESLDAGKLYAACWYNDIPFSVDTLRYFAGWCDKIYGKTIPAGDDDYFTYTRHEPLGVCGAIIPWNMPLMLFCWKFAPCIAAGNVLVLKPSELTPLTALYMASLVKEAGFPPGVLNVIPGHGHAGHALTHHMDVAKISFTGSTQTGRLVQRASADSNLKKVSLELGGKSPKIIFPDVNVDEAVEKSHFATFYNNGQMCCAGTRTYVHEDIYDEFVKKLVKRVKKGRTGSSSDFKTEYGPQISNTHKQKILRMIESGKNQGCTVLCGGDEVKNTNGYFVQPTVLVDLKDNMEVSKEEIFGPVAQIYKFKDVSEVVRRANDSQYGLASAVFTKDFSTAMKVSNAMETGIVWINCYYMLTPSTPFGGYKLSGNGKDLSEYALREYTQVKVVIAKL